MINSSGPRISGGALWLNFFLLFAVGIGIIAAVFQGETLMYISGLFPFNTAAADSFTGACTGIAAGFFAWWAYKKQWFSVPDNAYTDLLKELIRRRGSFWAVTAGAAVSEEILFRAAVLGTLVLVLPDIFALCAASFIFMLVHVPQYAGQQLIHAWIFALGLLLGSLFLWQGTLWGAAAAHAGYNAVSFLIWKRSEALQE
ncbi:type II CAAX prenyl endopeptidase Rce1 family protein [uncultured Marinococcus sp.]|jgi:membrane protease YdiL (CAAX protease family)|uniref:CPBP family glutamic-type intramembrane protease n=1 Tax=uncultured Marinococcus sp. TaxID=487012 RepID=UPI00260654C2|nr:CPBP family glutamic-type intramembrane protease [uncultured Marinococcus sp.]